MMNLKPVIILLFAISTVTVRAQLCQGSLGDPIVNITFGSGSNPGAPIAAAATGYQYIAGDCPNDGFYTIINNSVSCYGNSWFNITSDHTGNPGGYFMLVNASIQPSAFYLDTVRGLCGNTTYEFAAWIMNVIRAESCGGNSNQPNLSFTIEKTDGTLLLTYNTGNIAPSSSPQWRQYGFFLTTPANVTDIVLRIVNNAAGGCGNDLALDDITFRPCGPLLTPSIQSQTASIIALCEGSAATYTFSCAVSGGFSNPSFQWQQSIDGGSWTDIAGQTAATLTRNFPIGIPIGSYAYRLAVANAGNINSTQCRIASTPLTIKVVAKPTTNASGNSPVCEGQSAILSATGGVNYDWTGPGGFTGSGATVTINDVQLSQQGKYYVTVTSEYGCRAIDSVLVDINPSPVASTSFSSVNICSGNSVALQAAGGGTYEWQPSTALTATDISNPVASPVNTLTYSVVVTNSFNCNDTASVSVAITEPPHADAGPDLSMIENEPVQLQGNATGNNISYAWISSPYISNELLLNPSVNPPVDTKFILRVNSLNGCGTDYDTTTVHVYKQVFIPNAFTPNGDNINDTWYIPALNAFREFDLYVYNRFGEVVYHLKNENKRWDGKFKGKDLPVGAYTYAIYTKRYYKPFNGTVLIIR